MTSTAVAIVSGTNFRGGSGGGWLVVVEEMEEMEEIDEIDKGDERGEGGISVVKDKGVAEE